MIIFVSMLFAEHFRFKNIRKQLPVKKFITKTRIKAFTVSVLPWCAWFDIGSFEAIPLDPCLNRLGDELRPVI